jgi:IS4 transposase
MDEYPLEINRMLANMDDLQGNIPSNNIQASITDETVVRDFSSSPQEIIGEIVDATSKSADIVSHEVSVQSIEEYPLETTFCILCTDCSLDLVRILSYYNVRWNIETGYRYFKELLGFDISTTFTQRQ